MPGIEFSHYLHIVGSESGSTLTWHTVNPNAGRISVFDVENDGDLDSIDYYAGPGVRYSGYYYTAPNGKNYAIFKDTGAAIGNYYIPYNLADFDLSAVVASSGSVSGYEAENFVATGTPVCFFAGSLIATPAGEVAVEKLRIGDMVLTASGAVVPVKWLGRQTVSTRFGPAERLHPVRLAAGSLPGGLPHSDLTVTADHAILIDDVLCHAGALVNGTTITRVPLSEMGESYTVYHIETEAHDIILANGAPAETFIDNVSRRAFDNYAEFDALYGDVPEMEELGYPRAMSARQVPGRIRAALAGRTAA